MKSNNAYLKSIAKKTGNDDTEGYHSDNYYLKRIEDKIGKGGGGGGFSGDYNDLYNKPFIPSDVSDLTDTDDTPFTPKSHTHTESEITDLGDYADANHTHTESDITDFGNYADAIHTHTVSDITDFPNIELIIVTSNKGTASASTMNKLYIEVGVNKTDVYYTVEDNGTYSWEKLDEDILDDLSIDWSDIQNKPSTFAPSSHNHTMSDVSDLDTVEATVTYTDSSTDTLLLVVQTSNSSP